MAHFLHAYTCKSMFKLHIPSHIILCNTYTWYCVYMYVCMYVYIYIYTHTHTYVYVHYVSLSLSLSLYCVADHKHNQTAQTLGVGAPTYRGSMCLKQTLGNMPEYGANVLLAACAVWWYKYAEWQLRSICLLRSSCWGFAENRGHSWRVTCSPSKMAHTHTHTHTPNLPTNIVGFRGLDSSIILIVRGGIPRPTRKFPESLSQAMLVGIMLVGRLGVHTYLHTYTQRRQVSARRPDKARATPPAARRGPMYVCIYIYICI